MKQQLANKQKLFSWKKVKPTKGLVLAIPYFLLTIFLFIIPLIVVLISSFKTTNDPNVGQITVADNWDVLTPTIGLKIWNTIWISFISTFIGLLIALPFTYFLAKTKNIVLRAIAIALITAPIWMSMLIKLIGIKTFLDVVHGHNNSTYGHFYTIIGHVFIYMPFMLLPLYTALSHMPKNLEQASYDLGRGHIYTFFHVTIPYIKNALISGTSVMFLSCLTSVVISGFMNMSNDSDLIGGIILITGENGTSNPAQLSRAATLTLLISVIILALYVTLVIFPRLVMKLVKRSSIKKGQL
ncbi:ABC transporter permease [Ureaplasma sp. ES3154-GEN]|uniref:ABC transporter permease n=1 Tax=Ureaplasma sp. ES3154-GEN TaxID=2984844 RepID=UPI0021E9A130|nr:ABC transporter permease [Ureaplasma sp. ES3154-GEN]MCV3743869.1 ABC transporter permease [Ureaplasma sp. ES3154-GEN]